ncbi:gamma-glutamyltransferase [Herminiimonas fonticola]|uniref:Glutathione hydrolase proenzyme n=1 Tax=Herminiimonas fonticola TaxID=303380 RepID=A0A4R6GHS8_9BURK|nr:gamma-glutamyltransferase [Herminiimonas fonticola]RBA25392.1 gamma-glutamyltransferase [Herminiimonas fonticola]TDN94506.1 gamma-glutamyltransferase 1 [Herminiimonas fonticola]
MIKSPLIASLSALLLTSLLAGCSSAPISSKPVPIEPEGSSGYTEKSGWIAHRFMVAAANPLAVDAGYQMLKAGGSALDAAIATQMVLGLVEPQSSGIGGGAFMLYFDGAKIDSFDGRETAPASADEKLFLKPDGKVMPFHEAVVGGRSVGVPGVLRMLELAHKQYGKLPWHVLFEPAIRLARDGFSVSPRLAILLESETYLKTDPAAAAYFYDAQGKSRPVGYLLKNPALAATLQKIATEGADAFYTGKIAQDIARKVRQHPTNPGGLTVQDLAGYKAKTRTVVCSDYRAWTVCGMPPPSSGGIAIAQMLGMLETKNMQALAPVDGVLNAEAVHLFTEAGRLAYADRNRYIADPDFVPLPKDGVRALLDKKYLTQRAALIGEKSMGRASAGMPFTQQLAWGTDASPELPSTSHISIVDDKGNALAMTTTIENGFGSRQMVDGFLLNNELTDFSAEAVDADGPIANRVQPGKRPRSSMSPTLVFEKGTKKLVLSLGSPGGSAIINYASKTLVGMMDWGLNVQQAINLPNIGSRNGPTELEQGRVSDTLITQLKAKGHEVQVMEQTSGLHGIMRLSVHGEEVWFGAADPRREGIAKGD